MPAATPASTAPAAPAGPLAAASDLALGAAGGPLPRLSFTLHPGLTLVRGGEGRGKTRLLQLLSGCGAPPAAGHLQRPAAPAFHAAAVLDPALDPLPARDWLARCTAGPGAWGADAVDELAAALGLGEHLPKPLYMLSTGSRRKVGLLAAVASGAALTLLDTPYAALDARSCRLLDELLAEAAEDTRRAWVLADYEAPAGLADVAWAQVIDLGD